MKVRDLNSGRGREGVLNTDFVSDSSSYVSTTEFITDEELIAFMSAMNKRYGLDFTHYEIKSLKRGMGRLLMKHGMKNMLDLWGKILKDDGFFKRGIDDLLVNLTEMFRNPEAWKYIRDNLLIKYDRNKSLRVWHAGCSTGEEVYTMAILLEEKGLLRKSRILASDLSATALKKARKGRYDLNVLDSYLQPFLRLYPGRSLKDYFSFEDSYATIKPAFNRDISFIQHNLVSEGISSHFDIVFCRNVMIYFDEKLKNHVLTLIHSTIDKGGFLVLGYYDIMTEFGKSLFHVVDMKTKIYKKK